jgi:hypothetical protein
VYFFLSACELHVCLSSLPQLPSFIYHNSITWTGQCIEFTSKCFSTGMLFRSYKKYRNGSGPLSSVFNLCRVLLSPPPRPQPPQIQQSVRGADYSPYLVPRLRFIGSCVYSPCVPLCHAQGKPYLGTCYSNLQNLHNVRKEIPSHVLHTPRVLLSNWCSFSWCVCELCVKHDLRTLGSDAHGSSILGNPEESSRGFDCTEVPYKVRVGIVVTC